MPFVQAIDPTLAGQIDANGINEYASCGPYYFSSRTPSRSITLKQNPYYKGARAANADTIQVNVGNDVAVEYQNVEKGTSDYASGGHPGDGVEERRQQVRPEQEGRPRPGATAPRRPLRRDEPLAALFKNNPGLAKAVNWAVDRQAFSAQGGYLYGKRTGQILPPGMLGYKPQGIYPLRITANTRSRRRSSPTGNLRGGKAVLWSSNAGTAPLQAQLIQYNLQADRSRRRDQAAPAGTAVHERGQPADRDVRPDDRALGSGLRRPVRLREHPARRERRSRTRSTTTTRTSTSRSTTSR